MEMGAALGDAFSLWRKNAKGLILPALLFTAANLVSVALRLLPVSPAISLLISILIYVAVVLVYDYYVYSKLSGQSRSFLGFLAVTILSSMPAIVYALVALLFALLTLLHPLMSIILLLFLIFGFIALVYFSLRLILAKPLYFLRPLDPWSSVREAWSLSRDRVLHILGFSILAGIVAFVPVILVVLLLFIFILIPAAFFLPASPQKAPPALIALAVVFMACEELLAALYAIPFMAAAWISYTRHLTSSR